MRRLKERELIDCFNDMSESDQDALLHIARGLAKRIVSDRLNDVIVDQRAKAGSRDLT